METITFDEYQKKVIDLFKNISEFLNYHKINWWVHSGTLLAVKRNNRLILPWDDDIDIMVPYFQWKVIKNELKTFCDKNNLVLFDLLDEHINYLSYTPFSQIYSTQSFKVILDSGEIVNLYPFVDIFFAVNNATYSSKEWVKYSRTFPLKWLYSNNYDKYPYSENNNFVKKLMNFISYPISFFLNEGKISRFLFKPYLNCEGRYLRRADYWSDRDIIYDLENSFNEEIIYGIKIFANKDWEKELIESYGIYWKKEIIQKMHFQQKEKNIYNKYRNEYLKQLNKNEQ